VKNNFLKDYYTELRDYFLAGGKRIRPLLSIAVYNGFNKDKDEKIIIPSIGIEFLHNASLIHDDIIDRDDFRRGEPAFHYRFRRYQERYELKKMVAEDFGRNIGIIGGDSAFFLGLEAFLSNEFEENLNLKAIDYYKKAFIEVSDGVLIETDMVNQKHLTLEDYIHMISLKTGALIEKSILIGANYARVDEKYLIFLSTYGINLGIVFQIIDDILGTFGDEKKTGKPTDSDIREGKKTCLLIAAYNQLKNEKKARLLEIIEKTELTNIEIQEVKDLFIEANAKEICMKLAEKYHQEAILALNNLKPIMNKSEHEFLENLMDFVLHRNF